MTPRWPSAAATIKAVRPTPSVWSTEAVDSCKSDSATSQWPSCTAQINAVTSYVHNQYHFLKFYLVPELDILITYRKICNSGTSATSKENSANVKMASRGCGRQSCVSA